MQRKVKAGSGIYSFLEQSGLLEHGSVQEIELAKKKYWITVRKEWKREHRKEFKSYTISFNRKEQRLLHPASALSNCSINVFIKKACMSMLLDTPNIDKKIVGKIREALALFYSELQCLNENSNKSSTHFKLIIEKFTLLENAILSLLKHN